MRLSPFPILAFGLLLSAPALAQPAPRPAPPPAATPAVPPPGAPLAALAEDPVVARIDGTELRLSDIVASAAQLLPPEMRAMSPAELFPLLPPQVAGQIIERAIAERQVIAAARRAGLAEDPEVRLAVRRAEEQALTQAMLHREVDPRVTEAAVRARWERDNAATAPEEEVHARHILVTTEAVAREVLAELARGADFAAVARRRSSDGVAQQGGDLGWFKRGDMVPEFANAAFALTVGQYTREPVRTAFGWHIIKLEERRRAPAQSFEEVRAALHDRMVQEEVTAAVERLRAAVPVERTGWTPPAAALPAAPTPPPAGGGGSLLNNAAPPPPAGRTPPAPATRR
jgi:peptidyl-prolyl cis-trans isomerase C